MSGAAAGKGRRTILDKNATVTVVEIDKVFAKVETDTAIGYVKLQVLQRACKLITPEAKPPSTPVPGAGNEPSTAPTTPLAPLPPSTPPREQALPAVSSPSSEASDTSPLSSTPNPPSVENGGLTGVTEIKTEAMPVTAATPTIGSNSDAWAATDKARIAVMDLKASETMPKDFVRSLSTLVSEELDRMGPFKSISSQDIAQMLAFEKMKDTLGCDNVSCLAEIGGALGADYLVTGSVTTVGEVYLIQMQLMSIRLARVDTRSAREYSGGPKGLLDEVRAATKVLMRDVLAAKSGLLAIHVSEEGASIKLDGSIVGVSPMPPQTVAGGMHTLAVEKQGFVVFAKDVEVVAGQETPVQAVLRPSSEFVRIYREDAGTKRTLSWTGFGVGAVGVGGGVALFFASKSKVDTYNQRAKSYNADATQDQAEYNSLNNIKKQAATLETVSLVAGGVGVAALGIATVLFFTGPDPHRYDTSTTLSTENPQASSSFGFDPWIDLSPTGIVVGGRF